jgi:hypothetical protein
MAIEEGFFVDWDGHARSTLDPGMGDRVEVDLPAKYVAIFSKTGILLHEATYYKTLADMEKKIKAEFLPGSQPWGNPAKSS